MHKDTAVDGAGELANKAKNYTHNKDTDTDVPLPVHKTEKDRNYNNRYDF